MALHPDRSRSRRLLLSEGSAQLRLYRWRRSLGERQHQDWVAHNVTLVHVPLIRQASAFLQHVPRVMSTSELFWPTKLEICRFLQPGRVVRLESMFLCRVIQGRLPANSRAAMLLRASAATVSRARLHSRGPSTSPAPRSLGIGESLFNKGHVPMFPRCCCCVLERNHVAASRTAFHSIIPKQRSTE